MAILTEKKVWKRKSTKKPRGGVLTPEECANVRRALRFLRVRFGNTVTLAEKMGFMKGTIINATGKQCIATAALALSAARLAGVRVDDILAGEWPPEGACPHCGRC